jgi:hypothetical protein
MLKSEIATAREKLHQAETLISEVRGLCITGSHTHGARVTNEILGLIADALIGLDALQRLQSREEPEGA